MICHFVRQSIATITIYLIVLLQFKLSLVTQQIPPTLQASIAAQQSHWIRSIWKFPHGYGFLAFTFFQRNSQKPSLFVCVPYGHWKWKMSIKSLLNWWKELFCFLLKISFYFLSMYVCVCVFGLFVVWICLIHKLN